MKPLLLLALLGCAGARTGTALIDDVRSFQEGLRWRRYEQAAEFVPPPARERFLDERSGDDDLRIDDYEIVRIKLTSVENVALVQVRYTWHRDSRGIVHDTTLEERWERQGRIWRVVATEHKRGEVMPRLAPDAP